MEDISVIILTLNEENTIARAISSVKALSHDIVIVDSGSTDNTVQIAKKYGCRVFTHEFKNFADQRNFANLKAKSDWVLSMDSDEEIPSDLVKEIQKILHAPRFCAYLIPRRNIIFDKEIKHTRWSPDTHVWLYQKSHGSWVGDVHEEWVTTGDIGLLKKAKIHHSHPTVSAFIDTLNRYTDIEAKKLHDSHVRFRFTSLLFYSSRSFVGRYFLKQGYLDGIHGFVLSSLMSFYRFTTWIKLWELEKHA